jgi:putative oxidoreductase
LAGVIEFFGGLLMALGILTSYAAFIASGEMAFAYFTQHFPRGFWPIQNGGELAVLYCFLLLYIAANGSMVWGWRTGRRAPTPSPEEQEEHRTPRVSE